MKNKWIPHKPTEKQAEFLSLEDREVFYGGAAGGGKSDALLMAALQYFDVPRYAAIIFRRSYTDLALPDAIMDRADQWLRGTEAKWNPDTKTWTNPTSKATVSFGYLQSDNDRYRYQSAAFQFVGFDELTQFSERQYTYLFSRLRRLKGSSVPIRMRSASNPGGLGHEWVLQRFIVEGAKKGRIFIPASLKDNPYLDYEEYRQSLDELDPITKARLLRGDWSVHEAGTKFDRKWFSIVHRSTVPAGAQWVRYWDMASTEPDPGKDPDYTVGTLMALYEGRVWVVDVKRVRGTPHYVESIIRQTAAEDGLTISIYMEQEPGSSGAISIDHYARYVLVGYNFYGIKSSGDKEVRANPLSSAAQKGNVLLCQGGWVSDWLDEMELFPLGTHDDQVDSASGAFSQLTANQEGMNVMEYYRQRIAEAKAVQAEAEAIRAEADARLAGQFLAGRPYTASNI